MPRVRIATYNTHQWIGFDKRIDRGRSLKVLRGLSAQIIALQEVTYRGEESWLAGEDSLSRDLGMTAVTGPTLTRGLDSFGNVLLTSFPVRRVDRWDLSCRGREPRSALDVDVDVGGAKVRVIATHLGRRERERRRQVKLLLELVELSTQDSVVLMGDFNIWRPRSELSELIEGKMGPTPALRTYPALCPLLRLDRIWVKPPGALKSVCVYKTALSRRASDHLPVVGVLELPGP